jgi:hypothetical protein
MKAVQKCPSLIRGGKSSSEVYISKIAQLLSEALYFIIVK